VELQQFLGIESIEQEKKKTFEGSECIFHITDRVIKTEDGKEHKARVSVVDFRKERAEGEREEVVIHTHGLGGSSRKFNDAFEAGDFDSVSDTLEYQAIKEAKEKGGVFVQVQFREFPKLKADESFREDAHLVLAFARQEGVDIRTANVTLNGYSEGAGVARQAAQIVQEEQGPNTDFENTLRLFSLTETVPVEGVDKHFSKHIWDVVVKEAARRVNDVYPDRRVLDKEISTTREQFKLIGMIVFELTMGEEKEKAFEQLKQALNGNIPLLADVLTRMSYDFWNSSRQMKKFAKEEPIDLDERWKIEMRLPVADDVYPLRHWLSSMKVEASDEVDAWDKILSTKLFTRRFGHPRQMDIRVFGSNRWFDPERTHVGPTTNASEYYSGGGADSIEALFGRKLEVMPVDVEEELIGMEEAELAV